MSTCFRLEVTLKADSQCPARKHHDLSLPQKPSAHTGEEIPPARMFCNMCTPHTEDAELARAQKACERFVCFACKFARVAREPAPRRKCPEFSRAHQFHDHLAAVPSEPHYFRNHLPPTPHHFD